jgi:hypothetical protein
MSISTNSRAWGRTYRRRTGSSLSTKELLRHYGRCVRDQDGKCAICECDDPGTRRATECWPLDHDPNTGKLRGLLCHRCNTKLAWFEENEEAIIHYLRRWQ